ncbi:MAG: transcriptional repressor [Methylococcaceae bacterium]|nr:transcriptional repressor [Methylococcaceae bacterium]MDZ4156551.1 transcriptional repressor [Methylococcales bacterium]MDP2393615.1 transcriptional repressor [Methylococcaceae bacterium]MDP3020749.1 transcriptional repressor [Methylococcaceae bacterium]MDP3390496.1 transcriptional repressor [Methylococcaceae bacterium]
MYSLAEASQSNRHSLEHDHKKCVSKALGMAEHLCGVRGVKLTPIRQQVLELIWDSHKAVKAYDLLDRIKPLQHAAKPTTIYRALDFLIEQGLIHRVESLNAFVGCSCSGHQHELLLLICKCCNDVEERLAPKVMAALSQEFSQAGFVASSKAIEAQGICVKCSDVQGNQH